MCSFDSCRLSDSQRRVSVSSPAYSKSGTQLKLRFVGDVHAGVYGVQRVCAGPATHIHGEENRPVSPTKESYTKGGEQ